MCPIPPRKEILIAEILVFSVKKKKKKSNIFQLKRPKAVFFCYDNEILLDI